ncbi:MotA/TolQ/ExbB proton channel family protein [Candidatus Rhabdochlamydia sp. T3358]|uniref:MotA/TolQ/ExbB proton channel family protein n=1 Tax=Candidatus Rhabdochlamydia sp. T3358 TaxID=2099795 RepID=UPI0010BA01A2|nr:MotA/TolQ/ExbB proton channel family protein [Candidatus Rhabdochlamydia sp. T3358]VHN99686.1 Biopolymer transport protein ExbB [Candidatus Rhabdochlamydia sp. T3358]
MIMPEIPIASFATFITAYAQSDIFGKAIMLALIGLSLICWIILIQKIRFTHRTARLSQIFYKNYTSQKERMLQIDLQEANACKDLHPFAHILGSLKIKTGEILNKNLYFSTQDLEKPKIYLSSADLEAVESHVLTTISYHVKQLEKNLFILPTIVSLAPFLGLLGTVWGILVTFSGLQNSSSIGSNSVIIGGLSTALATTVLGLVIAIPALIAYNYLKHRINNYSSEMQDFLYELLSYLELQYRRVDQD